jgi:HPt (histidine-containing phosphotransfer) domain-containing protein
MNWYTMPRVRVRADRKKISRTTISTAMLNSVSPIDPKDAKDDVVKSLLPTFLQRRAGDVQRIRDALALNDFKVIATIGHNLRGNGASYGFPMLSSIGEAMEKGAVARDAAAIARALDLLTEELARIDSTRSK